MPLVSLITVVRNDADGLRRTLASMAVQSFRDFQLVVVDGASTDGTAEQVRAAHGADVWVSEPDEGIYHAMNKGIARATGEWLLFMNAGDEFDRPDALATAVACITPDADVIYSDWKYRESGALVKANVTKMNVRHQSVMYKKNLHETFGTYVVGKRVSISDFIFFQSISGRRWVYCKEPISVCDQEGVSANPSHFYQRIATEFIFGRRGRFGSAAILLLYSIYRFLKRQVLRKH